MYIYACMYTCTHTYIYKRELSKIYRGFKSCHSYIDTNNNNINIYANTLSTRPLERPRRRWEDNIKTDLQEVGRGCGDWMELAQDRDRWRALVSTVMNFGVP